MLGHGRPQLGKKLYVCWGCREAYPDPADFLWHIQYCNSLEQGEMVVG
ncbi:MAG: hypothetical protein KGH71_04930 [Candidatus Micrarchaeota archaeon]|nr:hypothetical protein [Candidatus Micrarchaeota archaeon]